ncbi:CRISPR-associated endonuclease Cas1, partial [Campylobacter canadensis]
QKQKSLKEVLHISKAGLSLSKEQEFFCVKNSKETVSKIHANKLKSIIINVNITLNSEVLFLAKKYKIAVLFVNKELESINIYTSSTSSKTFLAQAKLSDEKRLSLAKSIIIAKCKNQLNYIKRMNKYHKKYDENILKMMKIIIKLKKAKNNQEILAYEGGVALWYYECLCDRFNKYNFKKRYKKGAKDVVNMSLNYLYGILYNKILKLIIDNGLSPYVGLLHANNDKNISFVFDVIEEYRTYVVDFVVFGWFSYNPNVNDKDELSKELKEKLCKRFNARLLDKLSYKNQKISIENIITLQIQALKKAILNDDKYKGFCPRL